MSQSFFKFLCVVLTRPEQVTIKADDSEREQKHKLCLAYGVRLVISNGE